ncbi:hypothetical protein OSB53_23050 [Burkholderia pseudomallei]|nr:hypothetical protein [Burkholderia pseudomallei]UZU18872.1 hypothetical protein OSB53_23050 [Burkholderia pseudomallei]UZU19895.1 hypothetical protein OSB35_09780 [Burkholderia pseudomallei]UZU25803.1 hypothetical protein OSB54_09785 [Burkholderia pseudomallei]
MVDTSGKHRSIACAHALPRVSRAAHGPPLTRIKRALGRRTTHAAPPHRRTPRFDPIGQTQPNRAQFHLNIDDKRLRPILRGVRAFGTPRRPPRPGSKTLTNALTTARNERERATLRAGSPAWAWAAAPMAMTMAAAACAGAGAAPPAPAEPGRERGSQPRNGPALLAPRAARRSASSMQSTRQEDFHP